jgi:hypothetical protein
VSSLRPLEVGKPGSIDVHPSRVGGDPSAHVKAIAARGFTERQARFLAFVLRHSGVCVPRQYAQFAGTAQGAKCNAFFARLVQRGHALSVDCLHNRGRLYRLHARALYDAIGEGSSQYRRTVSPRVALARLARLDALLSAPELAWSTASEEKAAVLTLPTTETPSGACPICLDTDGRLVVLYVVTEWRTDAFRVALRTCAPALRAAPRWTLRIAVPRDMERVYARYLEVVHEELEGLFEGPAAPRLAEGWECGATRVESLILPHIYRHLSPLVDGSRTKTSMGGEGVEKGEARGDDSRRRSQPLAWTPWPSRDRRMVL